jgi:hypothetical protein
MEVMDGLGAEVLTPAATAQFLIEITPGNLACGHRLPIVGMRQGRWMRQSRTLRPNAASRRTGGAWPDRLGVLGDRWGPAS